MEQWCMCPMWEPKKGEEWEKWIKELREKMRGMGCMCPMWELKEEKKLEEERQDTRGVSGAGSPEAQLKEEKKTEEERQDTHGVSGAGSPEAHQRSAGSGAKAHRRKDG